MTPLFITLDQIHHLHRDLISHYGGTEGIRDEGLLSSAISMPMGAYGGQYLHQDPFEMAAAYLFHIVQNHPCLDGNKRTGAASAIIFLAMNDITIDNDEMGLADLTVRIASGLATKADAASFFRSRVLPPLADTPLTEARP